MDHAGALMHKRPCGSLANSAVHQQRCVWCLFLLCVCIECGVCVCFVCAVCSLCAVLLCVLVVCVCHAACLLTSNPPCVILCNNSCVAAICCLNHASRAESAAEARGVKRRREARRRESGITTHRRDITGNITQSHAPFHDHTAAHQDEMRIPFMTSPQFWCHRNMHHGTPQHTRA